jgi:hypothetical protein
VVRNSRRGGGNSGVREAETPISVNKEPVQAHMDGVILVVGPGEAPVEKGKLLKSHGIHGFIKPAS